LAWRRRGLSRIGHDVFNSGAGLRDFSLVVQLVGIVKLLLCDPYAHFRAVFGARLLKARLKFVDGCILGGGAQGKADA